MMRTSTSAGQTSQAPQQQHPGSTPRTARLTAAATRTVTLVLAEDSPLPETEREVQDLAARLRGHIGQLGVLLPVDEPVLLAAQRLGAVSAPETYVGTRIHLCRLAESVQELVAAAERLGAECADPVAPTTRRSWRLSRNGVRVLVFAVALVVLAVAACIPQA